MAASFPNAKKTFSAVVNGVTKLVALLFNSPYDEIEAIETFIGSTGSTQANNDSITGLLSYYRKGCAVEYKSATELYVRSGSIMIMDVYGNKKLRTNSTDTTVTWADIDTGSEANSTVYYVYALADSAASTFTVKFSASSSSPDGATYYRKIGTFYNDSSGNIQEVSDLELTAQLKNWITKSGDTVYQAITDGFVVGTYQATSSDSRIEILSDSANPPTTIRMHLSTGTNVADRTYGSFNVPVKKGDYYKCLTIDGTGTWTIYWLPLGT